MGFKSEVSDMLSDFAVLIERQVTGYERKELLEMIMFLKHGIVDSDNAERSA